MSLKVRLFRDDLSCLRLILPPALLLCVLGLGNRDLWDPDEPRTGVVVRSILESGSWAALSRQGEPYLEKPPLFHWLAAAASLPAGHVTETALRFPSSLAALLGLVTIFLLGRALFGRRVGALAAIVLCTSQDYFMEARTAHPDMVFTLCLALAALCFHRVYARGGALGWMAGFYAALGFAVLAKGPGGLLLPALAVVLFLAAVGDLAFLRRAGIGWGLPLALLPSVLWLAAFRAATGTGFPIESALRRLGLRVTEGLHHAHPFPHVLSALAIEFLPWTVMLPGAFYLTFPRRGRRSDRDNAYVYSWLLALFSVFALSAEKRGVYLLPLLPFLALLVARLWDMALFEWDPPPADRYILFGLAAGIALAAGASLYALPRVAQAIPEAARPAQILAGLSLLAGAVALLGYRRGGGGAALGALAVGLLPCYVTVAGLVLPALDRAKSARPFSERITAIVGRAPLGIYPSPHDGFAFYTRRPIEVLPDRARLAEFLRADPEASCLMEESQYEIVRRALLPDGSAAAPSALDLRPIDRGSVGHRDMLLVRAAPALAPRALEVTP